MDLTNLSEPVILALIGAIVSIIGVILTTWSQIKKYDMELKAQEAERKKKEQSSNTKPVLVDLQERPDSIMQIATAAAKLVQTAQEEMAHAIEARKKQEEQTKELLNTYTTYRTETDRKIELLLTEFEKVLKGVATLTRQLKRRHIEPAYVPDKRTLRELRVIIEPDPETVRSQEEAPK